MSVRLAAAETVRAPLAAGDADGGGVAGTIAAGADGPQAVVASVTISIAWLEMIPQRNALGLSPMSSLAVALLPV